MGGGGRYPYPKAVWSPSGGWWVQPKNWKTNTLVVVLGTGVLSYGLFVISTKNEERFLKPKKWIPSELWSNVKVGGKDS
ncbi:hypothetical protein BDZ89DRAFT_374023 [Hymenopellis radicata]|nr:hypothetical protein BDZ89DRAFT_374023 [Hymenopellis radicata]